MSDSRDPANGLPPGLTPEANLRTALRDGDPQRVRDLIQAGADIHYNALRMDRLHASGEAPG
ncbi:MAG TPA: hypothetical protein VFD71_07200 [Planctomycetota bacterium]|nr:hypothetical protein [Planctomycetota bacterium]